MKPRKGTTDKAKIIDLLRRKSITTILGEAVGYNDDDLLGLLEICGFNLANTSVMPLVLSMIWTLVPQLDNDRLRLALEYVNEVHELQSTRAA